MVEILNTGSTAWQHQLLRVYLFWVLCFHCDKVPKVTIEREKRFILAHSFKPLLLGPWICLGPSWLAFWACGETENITVGRRRYERNCSPHVGQEVDERKKLGTQPAGACPRELTSTW